MRRIDAELGKCKEERYLVQQAANQAYYERAMNDVYELMIHHPDRAEPYYEMGRIASNYWRDDEAEKNYQKALEIDPEYFPTYTQYSLSRVKEGRFDEAEM
jgi:tetratricopeptide (TPR) repeat protein